MMIDEADAEEMIIVAREYVAPFSAVTDAQLRLALEPNSALAIPAREAKAVLSFRAILARIDGSAA